MTALTVLAATLAPEEYKAGPTGLLVLLVLGIGVFFLGRSMIKHLKRVPPTFDPPAPAAPGRGPADDGADDRPVDDPPAEERNRPVS